MSEIFLAGGALVTRREFATLSPGMEQPADGEVSRPLDFKALFSSMFSRFGRFDENVRLGCLAVHLALQDARLETGGRRGDVGFLLAGQYGSFITDLAFYETTSGGGAFASPNLFSYTLPNIVIGECAHRFGLRGPTYCLDAEGGRGGEALAQAAFYLEQDSIAAMLVGWLEVLPAAARPGEEGAQVLVFEKQREPGSVRLGLRTDGRRGMRFSSGDPVTGLDDILSAFSHRWTPHAL
jgi:3-oxoacyl-[acyl-carrier-protein] synthase II